jgi:hypothetical protein
VAPSFEPALRNTGLGAQSAGSNILGTAKFLSDLIFSHGLVAQDENRPGSNSKGSNMRPAHHVLAHKTALNEFGQGRETRAALEFGRTNTEPIAILREK